MHAASSASLSLSEKTKKPPGPPTPTPTPSPPKVARRKGTDLIDDEQKRKKTQSKRSKGLVKRAEDNHSLTRVPVAAITFNDKDELCSFGHPSVEEVFLMYLHKKYDPKLSLKEWVDWAEKESDSCKTTEQCTSMIMKYQVLLKCLCEKLKALEKNPTVNAAAGRDLSTLASTEDSADHDVTLLDSAIASSESSAGNSNPMCPDLDTYDFGLDFDALNELLHDPFIQQCLRE